MTTSYRFGKFTLDTVGCRLYAHGALVPLASTDFRLLAALAESAGTFVAKEELVSRVWGRKAVSDNALYVHINVLRKTIGDDFIATKQGRGYRFVVPVQRVPKRASRPAKQTQADNPSTLRAGNDVRNPTRLIGRSKELGVISKLLKHGRLITLTGPGGVGKTRLALHAAERASTRFADGAILVELATLKDPDLVPASAAAALGVILGDSARPFEAMARHLARKSLLIVLDNCEHLVEAAALLCETLLDAAPGVTVLATSREELSCESEHVFEIPPLAVPPEGTTPPSAIRGAPAVELFMERATGADEVFRMTAQDAPLAARICRRLDGLPLAIEMAAAWAGVLGMEALDAKLDASIKDWLHARSSAPSRHATLRATLEWGYDLLSPAEQTVLCRLAVFGGSFTLQAAEAIAGDDAIPDGRVFEHLASLVRKSMIAIVVGSRPRRYRFLQTTRAFTLEKLNASPEAEAQWQRHASYVRRLFESADHDFETTSDAVWLERYGPLLDDLRGALDWVMERGTDSDDAIVLASASWLLWRQTSLFVEGRQRLNTAVARLRSDTPAELEARLRYGLGELLLSPPSANTAHDQLSRAVALYRTLDHPRLATALPALAFASLMLNRMQEAEAVISEAVTRLERATWPRMLARAYSTLLCIEARLGRFDAARAAGEKAARLCEIVGAERTAVAVAANLVEVAMEKDDVDSAVVAGRRLIARLHGTVHSDLRSGVLRLLAGALTARGDLNEALSAAREAAPLLRDEGNLTELFDHLALRCGLIGRAADAAALVGYTDAAYQKINLPRAPIGTRAIERLATILNETLPADEIVQLRNTGAALSEEQAMTLALSD